MQTRCRVYSVKRIFGGAIVLSPTDAVNRGALVGIGSCRRFDSDRVSIDLTLEYD